MRAEILSYRGRLPGTLQYNDPYNHKHLTLEISHYMVYIATTMQFWLRIFIFLGTFQSQIHPSDSGVDSKKDKTVQFDGKRNHY